MNNKGFTLAELLIVVAIIAVLVTIGIPIFTTQLEKSREATDIANVRSAYAEIMMQAQDNVEGTFSKVVDLKQTRRDWQSKGDITIGGISSINDYGTHWIGVPQENGKCTVTYRDYKVTFNWGGYSTVLNKRWLYSKENGITYLNSSYSDFKDNWKASVLADLLDCKQGQSIYQSPLSEMPIEFEKGYSYGYGYFVVDPNSKNSSGGLKMLKDSGEINFSEKGNEIKIQGNEIKDGQDVQIAIQFFKKDGNQKTYDLSQEELDAMANLLNIH